MLVGKEKNTSAHTIKIPLPAAINCIVKLMLALADEPGRGAGDHTVRGVQDARVGAHAGLLREDDGPPLRRVRPRQTRRHRRG